MPRGPSKDPAAYVRHPFRPLVVACLVVLAGIGATVLLVPEVKEARHGPKLDAGAQLRLDKATNRVFQVCAKGNGRPDAEGLRGAYRALGVILAEFSLWPGAWHYDKERPTPSSALSEIAYVSPRDGPWCAPLQRRSIALVGPTP